MTDQSRDWLAGLAYRAIAFQRLAAYQEARSMVEHYKGDLADLPETISPPEMEKRYTGLRELAEDKPHSTAAELAYIELVAQINGNQAAPRLEGISLLTSEEELGWALRLIDWLRGCANDRDVGKLFPAGKPIEPNRANDHTGDAA